MSKKTIVVADNSYTIRRIVELSLSEEDIDLISLENGLNLKEKLLEVKPTIILIDIKLPGFSGYEVCKFVAETESLKGTKVFLMKGSFEPADEGLLKDLKYIDIITKPFDSNALVSSIKKILEESPESEEAQAPPPAAEEIPSSMPEDVPEIDGVSPESDENISFSDIKDELDSEVIPREEVLPSEEITQGAQQEPDTLSPDKEEEDIDNPFMDDGGTEQPQAEEPPPAPAPPAPPESLEVVTEEAAPAPPVMEEQPAAPPPMAEPQPEPLEVIPEGPSDSEMDDLIGEPAPEAPSDALSMEEEPTLDEMDKSDMEDMVQQIDQPAPPPADDALEIIPEGEPIQEPPLEVTTEPEPQISIEPTMSEEELKREMDGLDIEQPESPVDSLASQEAPAPESPEPELSMEPPEPLETVPPEQPVSMDTSPAAPATEETVPEEAAAEEPLVQPAPVQPETADIQSEHIINKVEDKLASSVKEMLWEILPPLAEKMIKEEIDRIKAEVESASAD